MKLTSEVILCTYNGAEFVVEQLESIIAQTRGVDKVSIYDDRSSDGTLAQIKGFVDHLPDVQKRRFTIQVNPRNLGYPSNFANGVAGATADVLFLSDQDDIWEVRKVETVLGLFDAQSVDMVFSDGILIDESGRKLAGKTVLESYGLGRRSILEFGDRAFDLLLKRNYVNGAACAVRRTTAQQALPLPCDMPHDYWLALWCSLHGGIAATPEPLYRYRQHGTNVIGTSSSNPLYVWLGIWRQPDTPRERELMIWKAVTERIASLPRPGEIQAARRKVEWLSRVTPGNQRALPRVFEIFRSALDGSYRRHSPPHAFLRDLVSLIK